ISTTIQKQARVASYSYGKPQTDQYEHFDFWTKDRKPTDLHYSYGKQSKEVRLRYVGRDLIDGDPSFKVQFTNKYILYVIPRGLQLQVNDGTRKYNKTFGLEYGRAVKRIGTYCYACAHDSDEAMKIIRASYMK